MQSKPHHNSIAQLIASGLYRYIWNSRLSRRNEYKDLKTLPNNSGIIMLLATEQYCYATVGTTWRSRYHIQTYVAFADVIKKIDH